MPTVMPIMQQTRLEMQHLSSILYDSWSSGTWKILWRPHEQTDTQWVHACRQVACLITAGIHYTCVLNREHTAYAMHLKMQRRFTFGANRRWPARTANQWHNTKPVLRLALTSFPRHICLTLWLFFWLGSSCLTAYSVSWERKEALTVFDSGNLSDQWSLRILLLRHFFLFLPFF